MDSQLVIKYIKRKNKLRKIVTYTSNNELRKYHENVVKYLKKNVNDSIFAKAYVPKSSIYKNADAHLYNDIFIKMDIKDFFQNINHKQMAECLFFEINKTTNISRKECYDIVRKCSVGDKGLPLGLVTSPSLANLYMKQFDGRLYGYLKKMELENPIYTRYADDMIISFKYDDHYQEKVEEILAITRNLLKKVHLSLNERKTSVTNLKTSNHVRITGISITVDDANYRHISVGRKLKNEIFWKAINYYESDEKNTLDIMRLKGLFSFVLSVEKNGIDDYYSEGMRDILKKKGFNNIKEMIDGL